MKSRQFAYTVSAYGLSGPRTATCVLATSALRLAEQSCINIRMADAFGVSFTREDFRASLPIVQRMAKRFDETFDNPPH